MMNTINEPEYGQMSAESATMPTYESKRSHSLKQIGDCYLSRIHSRKLTKKQIKEKAKVEDIWNRFCSVVSAKNVRELTGSDIRAFYDDMFRECQKKNHSMNWMRVRFEHIKSVFDYAAQQLDDADDIIATQKKIKIIMQSIANESYSTSPLLSVLKYLSWLDARVKSFTFKP